ncbi:hypothetical protein GA0116948_103348 [Chitinophaga costaii]|uniref:Type IX secretion system membrane protein, PorP/SprF family n=1 Tax=Chitinophaga costaii TaxID=1335309 RepID=A0A1C4C173_9BACT|nr:hypothetical protein [Chitinophaga costaii]PUZ27385.1 hypothetical protein DCM91_03930 [Chitinophaga costaii]SCC12723.1 hypothetical protein GA0116948_103348 [Chitinophaga costaii]
MKHLLVIFCVILRGCAFAQVLWPVGKDPGLGVYSHHFQQVFATVQHPAALAWQGSFTAGIYAERRFMLEATNAYAAAIALPAGPGGFGLNMQHFGYSDYREQQVGFGYGRHLGKLVDIGLQVDYFVKSIAGYGQAAVTTFNGGVMVHISPQVHVGVDVFNPVRKRLYKLGEEQLAAMCTVGAGYEASQWYVSAVATATAGQPLLTRVACTYVLVKQLALEAGIATNAQYNFAGVSLRLSHLRIDVAGSYHPQLGITPAATLIWRGTPRDATP